MQALILAGGKGTRLRPLTVYTPKPVVPMVNRPFICYQLEILADAGITDITLSLNYQPDKIEDLLGDGSDLGVNLRYLTEPSPMGTAGGYRYAAGSIRTTTVVLNGDVLTDVDIRKVVEAHRAASAEATIVLTPVTDPSRFGVVLTDDTGQVNGFVEKPSQEKIAELDCRNINAGIYVLEPEVLELIPPDENRSFEYDVFPELVRRKARFSGYTLEGEYWLDIGSPASYLRAHADLLNGRLKRFSIDRKHNADVAPTADIDELSVIGEDCVFKPNVRISNSVIGPGVHIDERATVINSVVWAHTRVASLSTIEGSILGRSCYIGRNAQVSAGTVLGDKASVPDYSRI